MVKFLVWLEYNETNFAVDLFMLIDNTPKFSVEKGLTCIVQRQRHGFRPQVSLTVLRSWYGNNVVIVLQCSFGGWDLVSS